MDLIHNERLKLFATYLNGLAIAVLAVGGIAPLSSLLYEKSAAPSGVFVIIVTASCALVSAVLHWAGSTVEKASVMTTLQMLSFFIMPVGALVIAGLGFLWVRTWDKHEPKPGE